MIIIKKNGFTLIELILVIGIVASVAVILGTNFMNLIGNVGTYEDEVIAKGIAEAAFVYYESKDNLGKVNCITAEMLIADGYISSEQGLLRDYDEEDIKVFSAKVSYVGNQEKKVVVYKDSLNCSDNNKVINYED